VTWRPTAIFAILSAPASALGQATAAEGLPLVWAWLLAGAILLAALGWLLFGGGVRRSRSLPHQRPPRP